MTKLFFTGTRSVTEEGYVVHLEVRLASDEPVNAIQGGLRVPEDAFTVQSVATGGSLISLWPEPLRVVNGRMVFSGVIPGGYEGDSGLLFALTIIPKEGTDTVTFDELAVFANDGNGTAVPVHVATTSFAGFSFQDDALLRDVTPPEPFTPTIVQDQHLFGGGKYALVFATTDQGSGVDHYEVLEAGSEKTQWQRTESPYLLNDQSLVSTVYVRAVDRAGNFIIVSPLGPPPGRDHTVIIGGLIVVLLCVWIVKRRLRHAVSSHSSLA